MREMSDPTYDFIQKLFLQYYTECFEEVGVKRKFEEREFAALLMRDKIMVRHKGFKTRGELQSFLRSLIPSDVYYSSAYYEQPDASEMGMKGWIGADLIFDIDADHIPPHLATRSMMNGPASNVNSKEKANCPKNALLAAERSLRKAHGHVKNV